MHRNTYYLSELLDNDRVSNNYGNDRVSNNYGNDRVGNNYGNDRVSNNYGNDRVGNNYGNDRVSNNYGYSRADYVQQRQGSMSLDDVLKMYGNEPSRSSQRQTLAEYLDPRYKK